MNLLCNDKYAQSVIIEFRAPLDVTRAFGHLAFLGRAAADFGLPVPLNFRQTDEIELWEYTDSGIALVEVFVFGMHHSSILITVTHHAVTPVDSSRHTLSSSRE